MAETSKYTIEERLIVSVWVHQKERTGMAKPTKKSEKNSFFVSIKQIAVKPIFKKPRHHKVRQLPVILLNRKSLNYSDEFCWTTDERDHPFLQNYHSRNAQAGKKTDMAAHSTEHGKWWCTYRNIRRLTRTLTGPGKFIFAYFRPLILGVQ